MIVMIDRALPLTQDLVFRITAVRITDTADTGLQLTRMLHKMLNLERTTDPKVVDPDHRCTLVPKIRVTTANPEVTVGQKVLDKNYRLTETLEIKEVKVSMEVTVGEKVLDGNHQHTETPEIREVKVNPEATVGQKVSEGRTPTTQTLRIGPQRGDRRGIEEVVFRLSKKIQPGEFETSSQPTLTVFRKTRQLEPPRSVLGKSYIGRYCITEDSRTTTPESQFQKRTGRL